MIILASASPRRRELLEKYGVEFTTVVTDVDESVEGDITPVEYVLTVSRRKAEAAVKLMTGKNAQNNELIIIAADTIVCIGGRVLGKPKNRSDARSMLKALSGNQHIVYTGLCVVFMGESVKYTQDCCATTVKFKTIADARIEEYLDTDEPYDKAGAYAIQGEGSKLIEKIDGCYDNVVGLPVERLFEIIKGHSEGHILQSP